MKSSPRRHKSLEPATIGVLLTCVNWTQRTMWNWGNSFCHGFWVGKTIPLQRSDPLRGQERDRNQKKEIKSSVWWDKPLRPAKIGLQRLSMADKSGLPIPVNLTQRTLWKGCVRSSVWCMVISHDMLTKWYIMDLYPLTSWKITSLARLGKGWEIENKNKKFHTVR